MRLSRETDHHPRSAAGCPLLFETWANRLHRQTAQLAWLGLERHCRRLAASPALRSPPGSKGGQQIGNRERNSSWGYQYAMILWTGSPGLFGGHEMDHCKCLWNVQNDQ